MAIVSRVGGTFKAAREGENVPYVLERAYTGRGHMDLRLGPFSPLWGRVKALPRVVSCVIPKRNAFRAPPLHPRCGAASRHADFSTTIFEQSEDTNCLRFRTSFFWIWNFVLVQNWRDNLSSFDLRFPRNRSR